MPWTWHPIWYPPTWHPQGVTLHVVAPLVGARFPNLFSSISPPPGEHKASPLLWTTVAARFIRIMVGAPLVGALRVGALWMGALWMGGTVNATRTITQGTPYCAAAGMYVPMEPVSAAG